MLEVILYGIFILAPIGFITVLSIFWVDAIDKYVEDGNFCYCCPEMFCDHLPSDSGCMRRENKNE